MKALRSTFDSQNDRSVVCWIWITEPSTTFLPRNWACRKFVQSWFQKSHQWTNGKLKECVSGPSWTHWKWRKFFQTGDESWIFEYDPETKRQSSEWHTSNSLYLKKATMSKSKIKSTLICFYDSQGVVHKEFVPQGQTVNQQYYHEFLERPKKGFTVSDQRLRTLGCCITTALPVTLPPLWTNFWPKRVFQLFRRTQTRLIWVRVTSPFCRNSNSTSKVVILELWTTSKGRDRPAEGTSTWRLPALLPGVGGTSLAVWGFPRELLWRG